MRLRAISFFSRRGGPKVLKRQGTRVSVHVRTCIHVRYNRYYPSYVIVRAYTCTIRCVHVHVCGLAARLTREWAPGTCTSPGGTHIWSTASTPRTLVVRARVHACENFVARAPWAGSVLCAVLALHVYRMVHVYGDGCAEWAQSDSGWSGLLQRRLGVWLACRLVPHWPSQHSDCGWLVRYTGAARPI